LTRDGHIPQHGPGIKESLQAKCQAQTAEGVNNIRGIAARQDHGVLKAGDTSVTLSFEPTTPFR
jgi:S-adenosylmethionine synthetase